MTILYLIILGIVVCYTFVIFFGAPFLPTLSPQVKAALELAKLKPGQTLLELGSGDGRVMLAAARSGLNVIGYELNPLLVVYSRLRTWRYRKQVKVVWGNFWRHKLPKSDGIFVFLLDRYMARLDKKIIQDLGRGVKLVSFAFKVPGRRVSSTSKSANGLYLYKY